MEIQRNNDKGGQGRTGLVSVPPQADLFEGLKAGHLLRLVSRGRRRVLEAGRTVFLQGDRADGLYVVLSGRGKVSKTSPRGRKQILRIMGPGEPVGEVARRLQQLACAGAVETKGRKVHIEDRGLLERVAGVR